MIIQVSYHFVNVPDINSIASSFSFPSHLHFPQIILHLTTLKYLYIETKFNPS